MFGTAGAFEDAGETVTGLTDPMVSFVVSYGLPALGLAMGVTALLTWSRRTADKIRDGF